MKRVWIIGASGSGKSTLARQLADTMGANCVDLDELNWRPGWQQVTESDFVEAIERALEESTWVVAGNYTRIQTLFLYRADTIVWLDYPLFVVVGRQIRRIIRRVAWHEPCCNGNFETLGLTFSRESVLLWLLKTYRRRKRSGWDVKRQSRLERRRFLHFRRPRDCKTWLDSLEHPTRAR